MNNFLTKTEIILLSETYPDLYINQTNKGWVIEGNIKFNGTYNFEIEKFIINDDSVIKSEFYIQDEYKVRIEKYIASGNLLPSVKEIGGKIKKVAILKDLPLLDMHIYPKTENLCLGTILDIENQFSENISVFDFIDKLLKPYLYEQSFFAKFDYWPWGERSHGLLGELESLHDYVTKKPDFSQKVIIDFFKKLEIFDHWKNYLIITSDLRNIKGHHVCVCGSQKRFRDCHPEIFYLIHKLSKHISHL